MGTPVRLARLVVVKLASLPVPVCHLPRRDARTWTGSTTGSHSHRERRTEHSDISEEDLDTDEVESQLDTLVKEAKKKEKAAKFHKIRRQMSSRGSPERRLTWDAIEQIRFLKQESPKEWTLERLAEGFSVSADVISRVLRSKFLPPQERRLKQDARVLAIVKQVSIGEGQTAPSQKGQPRLPIPVSTAKAMISSGNMSTITTLTSGALVPVECETGLVSLGDSVTSVSRRTAQVSPVAQNTLPMQSEQSDENQELMDGLEMEEEEEEWDGVVLAEEELEEMISTLYEKPSPVEQKGRNFYDSEGNFLYRI